MSSFPSSPGALDSTFTNAMYDDDDGVYEDNDVFDDGAYTFIIQKAPLTTCLHAGDLPPLMDLSDDEDSDGPLLPMPMSFTEEDEAWADGM